MTEFKLFDLYDLSEVKVSDPCLVRYISLSPVLVPRSFGRNGKRQFGKSKSNIVERLIGRLMVPGHKGKKHYFTSDMASGKFATAYNLVKKTLEIVEKKSKKNPIQVLVDAIENGSPREEVTTIGMGGRRVLKQVDTSPQRRVDLALRWMVQGAYLSSINKNVTMESSLANQILSTSSGDPKAYAVSKRQELEAQAQSSR